jgi:hypothetical protein
VTLWWFTRSATRVLDARHSPATVLYDRIYDGLLEGARRTTAATQSGSLPLYLAVVLSTVAVSLLVALAAGATDSISSPRFSNSPIELVAVLVTGLLAVANRVRTQTASGRQCCWAAAATRSPSST